MKGHLMASFVQNVFTKNYQNLITGFHVTVENVRDAFSETQCMYFKFLMPRSDKISLMKTSHCM